MNTIKTNKYIYPFRPFQDLSNKHFIDNFKGSKIINTEDLCSLALSIFNYPPKIQGENFEDKILSIFLDSNYLLGPREYLMDNYEYWKKNVRRYINKREPIPFVIMACPYKIQVPLKTNRTAADFGEVLFLIRMKHLVDWIQSIYSPGAQITILAEGILGTGIGVSENDINTYYDSLIWLFDCLNIGGNINIHNLSQICDAFPEFIRLWNKHTDALFERYNNQDPFFIDEYRSSYKSFFRMIPCRQYQIGSLMDVYNHKIPMSQLSPECQIIRKNLQTRAKDAVFSYRAFLNARDEINYIERIKPGSIKLTLAPKPKNIGVCPVNKYTHILPHHGVPVYHPRKKRFQIEYLVDIRRSSLRYQPVYIQCDFENLPFYYEEVL